MNQPEIKKPNRTEEEEFRVLETEGYESEAELPKTEEAKEVEMSEAEYEKQKKRLAQEWHNFTSVEMPKNIDFEKLSDEEFTKLLYENLVKGVDLAIAEIGFEINNGLLAEINQETDTAKKTELQKQFIDSIIKQTRGLEEGGKFNRGKEDKWSFYPKQIKEDKRVNCSGATLLVGRILEKAGFKVDHGEAAHHAVSVAELADGNLYYVDSRRNSHNILALENEAKPIGDFYYHELKNPKIAYEKIIPVPKEQAEVNIIISNYSSMRHEADKNDDQDEEATKQIEELDKIMGDINFDSLWGKLSPKRWEFHIKNSEWQEEEKRVDAKHNFSDQVEKAVSDSIGNLSHEQKVSLTNELQKNGEKIYEFCSNLNYDLIGLKDSLSPEAYQIVTVIRDTLESIRQQSQPAYEFALVELKAKISE